MRFLGVLALIWVITVLPASADQLYIRNQPFKGATSGSGQNMEAALGPLVTALGFTLTELSGNQVVTGPKETAALPEGAQGTGHLYIRGKMVAEATGPDSMVSVSQVAGELGAVVRVNAAMGTVDVSLASARLPASSGTSAPKAEPPSSGSAGYRLVAFLSDKYEVCRWWLPVLARFESELNVPVTRVNVDAKDSPSYQQYAHLKGVPASGPQPATVFLLDQNGAAVASLPGYLDFDMAKTWYEASLKVEKNKHRAGRH